MSRSPRVAWAAAVLFGLTACTDAPVTTPMPVTSGVSRSLSPEHELGAHMNAINAQLAATGASYRAALAEYVTLSGSGQAGGTVLSKVVGNQFLDEDFIPFDERRAWSLPGPQITFAIDQTGDAVPPFGALTAAQTTAAIVAAMATWDALTCSTLPLVQNPSFGLDVGVVAFLLGLGGSPFVFGDVHHAGWRDINFAGGILGVTFTFVFVDEAGEPTDVDGNGRLDVAFREIYYDPSFSWAVNGVANVDVQTVALHEMGHGLSQDHFGKVWLKNDGSLAASPRAVMNALYAGPLRILLGPDIGGHCGNWSEWPAE